VACLDGDHKHVIVDAIKSIELDVLIEETDGEIECKKRIICDG
jgi:hypothetical protein